MEVKTWEVLEMAVEGGVKQGWHRAHKHLDAGQTPTQDSAISAITDSVMLGIEEFFTFDSPASQGVKEQILEIVERALKVKDEALGEGSRDEKGYPYCAGYMESALVQIASIVRASVPADSGENVKEI